MKIIKTKLKGENIAVYTDEFPDTGFYIRIDDVSTKEDIITEVQLRVDAKILERNIKNDRRTKYNLLKV